MVFEGGTEMMFGCFANLRVFSQNSEELCNFFIAGLCFPVTIDNRHEKIYEAMHAPLHAVSRR